MELKETSFVLICNVHNPSVISEDFVIESKLFEDGIDKEVDFLISNYLTKISLVDGTSIEVNPQRLVVKSPTPLTPFKFADYYINELNHLRKSSFGINLKWIDKSEAATKLFDKTMDGNAKDWICDNMRIRYHNISITLDRVGTSICQIDANCHFSAKGDLDIEGLFLKQKEIVTKHLDRILKMQLS